MRRRTASLAPLVALALLLGAAAPAAAERIRVALLPVVVHSSESRDHLQRGLSDMLVARLGRDPRLAVIEIEDAAAATTDPAAARSTARGAGAAWVVFGSFTSFGGGASLDLQLAQVGDQDGDPQQVFAQAASMGALIPMLEGVAERITTRVLGGAAPEPAAAGASPPEGGGELAELRRRVEALERAVDQLGAARMPQEPTPVPTVQPSGPRPERE